MIKANKQIAALETYIMYLLTGAACLLVGTTLPYLMNHYNKNIVAIVALGSVFAVGRVSTVFVVGYISQKLGAKTVLTAGIIFLLIFILGLPLSKNYNFALVCSFFGGMGMGAQDAACPAVLVEIYPNSCASAFSAGQAFFGAGCFLPPFVLAITLYFNLPFYFTYYVFAVIGLLALGLMPFMKLPKQEAQPTKPKENIIKTPKKPVKIKFSWLMLLLSFGSVCFFYCASLNTISLYTISFAINIGLAEKSAAMLLSVYNIGNMLGAIIFIGILKKVKPINVLAVNLALASMLLMLVLWVRSFLFLGFIYFATGIFIGVLFSILLSIAVGLAPQHTSLAAAVVAMLSGAADIISPLITGAAIVSTSIMFSIYYIIITLGIALLAALIFRLLYGKYILT